MSIGCHVANRPFNVTCLAFIMPKGKGSLNFCLIFYDYPLGWTKLKLESSIHVQIVNSSSTSLKFAITI